jgi:hypothetical protein
MWAVPEDQFLKLQTHCHLLQNDWFPSKSYRPEPAYDLEVEDFARYTIQEIELAPVCVSPHPQQMLSFQQKSSDQEDLKLETEEHLLNVWPNPNLLYH